MIRYKDPYRDGGAKGAIDGVEVVRRDDGAILDVVTGEVVGALYEGIRGGFIPNEKGKRDLRFAKLADKPFEGVDVSPKGKLMSVQNRVRAEDEMAARLSAAQNPVIPDPEDPRTGTVPSRQQTEARLAERLTVGQNTDSAATFPQPKPKFSASRAMEFSDGGGYTYLIDPQTKVVKITKAPASNKKAEGALLTGQGKNKAAYDAIWSKYGDKVEKLATRSPLDIEVGDDVEEEEIGEAPPDKFVSTRGTGGGPNAEAGRNARKTLIGGSFG
jgi:hypothetical protein